MAVLPPDPVFTLRRTDMGAVSSLCFDQDERLLAGTIKGSVYLWDLQTNRSLLHFTISKMAIHSIHHTKDMLITQEKGGPVTLWCIKNSGYRHHYTIKTNYVGFCRTAMLLRSYGDNNLICYPYDENKIGIAHINDVEIPPQTLVPDVAEFPKLGKVFSIKPFEYGEKTFVIAGYEHGQFLTWDLCTGTVIDVLQLEAEPLTIDYDPITNKGITGGPSDKLAVISYQRKSMKLQRSEDITIKKAGVNCIRIRADRKVFAMGGWDGRIRIFSWNSLRPLAALTAHRSHAIMDIAYSSGPVDMWRSPLMAVGGLDGQITLWNLYN